MSPKDFQRDANQQAIARWENEGGALNPFAIETSTRDVNARHGLHLRPDNWRSAHDAQSPRAPR
jgi:hypothetical protein